MRSAVCGLGRLGAALAAALVADGQDVSGWNRTPRELPGIRAARTAADAVRHAEVVVVAVFDGPAARSVLLGPDGVAVGAAPGTLVINVTTLAPEESRRLAHEVRGEGLRYLEAPVVGSVSAVRSGALRVLVGGAEEDALAAEPVLRVWSHAGSRRLVGRVGAASALKLVANLALGIAAAGLHDAVRLGTGLGLARDDLLDVLQEGPIGPLVAGKRDRLSHGAYAAADFTVAALAKDLALARAAVDEPLAGADAAARLVGRVAELDGSLDIAALGGEPARAGERVPAAAQDLG
ncbi:NAD(P)-dependent oxidoreductase [Streptomyces profundus]|uniref:NAD(P)-dependent oxidoreductase n=1 Tax=Streptomyces profundus TaxID=2867410 RepID=UPI001D1643C7|nr:NAD(P)-binding domain-containing protein [Streptomyces sp. MA3_2.13]UED87645.1 NAD(P)-binding domain-containing protein [Streptomyces sp. MA3_2.13]